MVWYEGSGTGDRRWLIPDERGSVIAVTGATGSAMAINSYDAYGIPAAANLGRFQYTGQAWLPDVGLYYYKARIYSPTLGRFMQTDPIGYGDSMNLYAYVGNDPINATDPSGLTIELPNPYVRNDGGGTRDSIPDCPGPYCSSASRGTHDPISGSIVGATRYEFGPPQSLPGPADAEAVVTATRPKNNLLVGTYCNLASRLGGEGRARGGADAAAGFGAFIRAGVGLSIRGDGSIEFDAYFGAGLGVGLIAGVGGGGDNAGGIGSGVSFSPSHEVTGSIGFSMFGGGFSLPNSGRIFQPSIDYGSTQGSGGLSAGPRVGLAFGTTKTANFTARTSSPCN